MNMIQLKYIRCPNCNRINGAVSIDNIGVQQFICKDSRCRNEFYVVNANVDKNFNTKIVEFV